MLHRADGVGGASGMVHIQCKARGVRTQDPRGLLSLPWPPHSSVCSLAVYPDIESLKDLRLAAIEDNDHFFLAYKWSHILQLPRAHPTTDRKILKDFDPWVEPMIGSYLFVIENESVVKQ